MTIPDSDQTLSAPAAPARLSPWERARRVFVSPGTAAEGLDDHVQWWIPLLLTLAMTAIMFITLYDRAFLPMLVDQMDQQVVSGQVPTQQADKIEDFYSSKAGLAIMGGSQLVAVAAMTFVVAMVVWFGVGFVLGAKFRYRLALESVCWAGLVTLPSYLVMIAIAWSQETMKGIHLGLAALLPQPETPTKLSVGLAVFLDAISPFAAWNLFVLVLICSSLAGAPRRNVAWVLVSLYLALFAIAAVVSGLMAPGA